MVTTTSHHLQGVHSSFCRYRKDTFWFLFARQTFITEQVSDRSNTMAKLIWQGGGVLAVPHCQSIITPAGACVSLMVSRTLFSSNRLLPSAQQYGYVLISCITA